MIKTIVFDLDDTLYDNCIEESNEVLINSIVNKYSISKELVAEAFEYGKSLTKELVGDVAASHNRFLYIQHMLEHLGVVDNTTILEFYDDFWKYYLSNMQLRPGVLKTLSKIKARGIKIGICTDLTAYIQYRKLKALKISEYIDFVVTSEEAGSEKPSTKIFDLVIKKSNMIPDDILFIGDNYKKDYEGSKKSGMKSIWYQSDIYKDFWDFYEKEIVDIL